MTSPSSQAHKLALDLAGEGKHQQALTAIQEHLSANPQDGVALNDAGAILYVLGRLDEAAEHFRKALDHLNGEKAQALWNLSEVCLAGGKPGEVLGLFDQLASSEVLTPDLANRVGNAMLQQGNLPDAAEALLRSLRMCPEQEVVAAALENIRLRRPKVAFFCENSDVKFLQDIYRHASARYETRMCTDHSEPGIARMMQWCDIAWFEWCSNHMVVASALPKTCRIICRLHRYEAYTVWPAKVNWNNVDVLVTVGSSVVLGTLLQTVPDLQERTTVVPIPNGVDLERFAFKERPRGKNLAFVAYLNLRKNPGFMLQCFHRLHQIDSDFRLFVAGPPQDEMLAQYLAYMVEELGLQDCVFFEGEQTDVASWLDDKHFLVSTSMGESQGVNIIEGAARGLKPVVHTFPGCRDFYPDQFLFRTPEEFCQRILTDSYEPASYRDWVAGNFSLTAQMENVNKLFLTLEKTPWEKTGPAEAAPAFEL